MGIDSIDREHLREILKDFFMYANKMMMIKNEECLLNNISERFVCASLKTEFDLVLNETIFSDYYADVEYNRGGGRAIKSFIYEGEVFKMTCDFILHSRGHLNIDNLLCLEMKKSSASDKNKEDDRRRLCSLTMPGGCETKRNNTIVRDYVLGIFYIIDSKNKIVELEYYEDGSLSNREKMSFEEIKNYRQRYIFIGKNNL